MGFKMFLPTRVLFGKGQLNKLKNQKMPGKKALIVISNGKSTKENGYLDKTEQQLKLAGVEWVIFDKIQSNPLKSTIMEGAKVAREENCDFVVALGGGSVMDSAKVIAAMAVNEGDIWDYINGGTGKAMPIKNKPLSVIAITTTAGTGSEVDQWGVVSNDETNEKMAFGGIDELFPVLAIVDPELMTSVPPMFTAYQGFDALFHSTEVYISKYANLMSDMVSLTAIENIYHNLPIAVKDGNNIDAREKVAFGNTLSGYAMVCGCCTSEHSLEHALSAYHHNLPHGAGLIMISKAYYTHIINRHVCDDRFIKMAQVMGMKDSNDPMDFIVALTKLQNDCGVSELKMSEYGITPEEFEQMAINAKQTMGGLFLSDRCEITTDDCIEILKKSYM